MNRSFLACTLVVLAWSARARADDEEPPPEPPRPKEQWSFAIGPEIGARTGVGPGLAPFVGISYAFALRTARLFAPSIHLSADVATLGRDLGQGGTLYRWIGGAARVCPIHALLYRSRVRLAPCASMEVGLRQTSSAGPPGQSAALQPWLAPVAGGSVLWLLASSIGVELNGGVLFPLVRAHSAVTPDYDVPPIAGTMMVTLHWRFL